MTAYPVDPVTRRLRATVALPVALALLQAFFLTVAGIPVALPAALTLLQAFFLTVAGIPGPAVTGIRRLRAVPVG